MTAGARRDMQYDCGFILKLHFAKGGKVPNVDNGQSGGGTKLGPTY